MVRTLNEATVQVYSAVVLGLLSALAEAASVVAVVGVLLILRPLPAVVAMLYFGVVGLAFTRLIKRKAAVAGERFHVAVDAMYQSAFHALGGVKEIKVRQRTAHFAEEFEGTARSSARRSDRCSS